MLTTYGKFRQEIEVGGSVSIGPVSAGTTTESFKQEEWYSLYRHVNPSSLHAAVMNQHTELLKGYLDRGADVNEQDFQGCSPLHSAAFMGSAPLVRFLLEQSGLDIEVIDEEGRTPLALAIHSGNVYGQDSATIALL